MTLFFNLSLLESETKNDPKWMVEVLHKCFKKQYIRKYTLEKYPPIHNLQKGTSFLLEPEALFKSKADNVFKAQYIRLAGRRDYNMFSIYGEKCLDLSFFPDIKTSSLTHNTLLTVTGKKVYFKLE